MRTLATAFVISAYLALVLGCSRSPEESNTSGPQQKTLPEVPKSVTEKPVAVEEPAQTQLSAPESTVESTELVFDDTKGLAYHSGKVFTGKATQHYENGQLSSEVHYFEGQRHGLESSFFEDGAKKFEARFEANQLVGVFEEWYQNGQRKSQEVWQQGKRRSITEWDENGNLLHSD